jgi:hypothetical protein
MVTRQLSVLSISLLTYQTDQEITVSVRKSASEKELLFDRLRVRKTTVFIMVPKNVILKLNSLRSSSSVNV